MIYDCFTFFNELELLKVRLSEVYPYVDAIILAEANITFSGQPKSFIYEDHKDLFTKYHDKIRHLKFHDLPLGDDPWARENFTRDRFIRAVDWPVKDDDIFIVSDVDEIPRGSIIPSLVPDKLIGLSMPVYRFYLDWVEDVPECAVRVFNGERLQEFTITDLRRRMAPEVVIPDAGWHFTYMGGNSRVKTKINAFCHHQDEEMLPLLKAIETGDQPRWRNQRVVQIDNNYPKHIVDNLEHFRNLGWLAPSHIAAI